MAKALRASSARETGAASIKLGPRMFKLAHWRRLKISTSLLVETHWPFNVSSSTFLKMAKALIRPSRALGVVDRLSHLMRSCQLQPGAVQSYPAFFISRKFGRRGSNGGGVAPVLAPMATRLVVRSAMAGPSLNDVYELCQPRIRLVAIDDAVVDGERNTGHRADLDCFDASHLADHEALFGFADAEDCRLRLVDNDRRGEQRPRDAVVRNDKSAAAHVGATELGSKMLFRQAFSADALGA